MIMYPVSTRSTYQTQVVQTYPGTGAGGTGGVQQSTMPTPFSQSLLMFCCGGCRKNGHGLYGHPQTQLLNPSISNNYLYQQHFQHLQQPKPRPQQQQQQILGQQQQQQQQQQQSTPQPSTGQHQQMLVAATPTVVAPSSSLVPGGGQQRYVGNLSYVMQQQHPIYHQLPASGVSPSRSYLAGTGIYTKQPIYSNTTGPYSIQQQQQALSGNDARSGRIVSDMILQPESFRRISGLTSEVFRQIEAVEAQFDPSTLAAQYAQMERRGEMIIRILSPAQLLPQWLDDTVRRYGDGISLPSWIQFVEIIKRPGQTLGLYIREGDGVYTMDGVYISRIALESPVYQSGCLRVGDEVLAINFVDVSRMSLDDVVLIMSIPRRLILTIRSRPLNAEHMLTNRNIYGTGMSDSYYDTVAGDIYSRVDDLRQKPVVVVKQQLAVNQEMLDEEEEEDVLAAATAAAEAGLLDDPSTAAAAAVAALHDPTPAKAAAAVAAVTEMAVVHRSGSSLDLYDGTGSGAGRSLLKTSPRRRRMFTSDNLADLYQNEVDRYRGTATPTNARTSLSSLYHGRLTTSSRARSATGRLMRTASEQMLYGSAGTNPAMGGGDPCEQIDQFLQRYQTLKQMQHRHRHRRHHSLDHGSLRNSFSSQSLVAGGMAGSYYHRQLETMGAIPLPGMAEAVAIARRRYLRADGTDGSFSDTETPNTRTGGISSYRSNSLPRTGDIYSAHQQQRSRHHHHHHHHQRPGDNLSHRLQQLEQFYTGTKRNGPATATGPARTGSRPHSAIGSYSADGDSAEILSRMRGRIGHRLSQPTGLPRELMSPSSRSALDSLRLDDSKSSSATGTSINRVPSTSAIYETIRKSKMAQDVTQPHSGRLLPTTTLVSAATDEVKCRISGLQHRIQTDDYHASSRHITDLNKAYDLLSGGDNMLRLEDSASSTATAAQPPPGSSLIGQISTRPSRTLMIDPSGFQQYSAELHRQAAASAGVNRTDGQVAGYSGLLVIHLLGVRGLQLDQSKTGSGIGVPSKRVLYCVVECDRIYKARTVAVQSHENNPTNFDWDEVFDIDLFDTKEVSFLFYTWDQSLPDLNMRHKQCSKGTIHLPWIPALATQHVHAFELRLYETPGAMFYIKLEYHDLNTTFKRTKRDAKGVGIRRGGPTSSAEQPLFGVDLEMVIEREASGFGVPIIIKRCAEEIERRGLHMLGIYRLCGSSLVKRTLRESFERNPWIADISPENVPDINVITSLLKDYLRELPEPLFNKAMFDMMDDGLSVCVPDDPTGNAKLMFSILECLPKSHRNTVLYLMDHIKLVHMNSDRNKMTSQALAICFGPLFSCHDQSESVYKPIQVFKFLLDIWPRRKGSDESATTGIANATGPFNLLKMLDDAKPAGRSSSGELNATPRLSSSHRFDGNDSPPPAPPPPPPPIHSSIPVTTTASYRLQNTATSSSTSVLDSLLTNKSMVTSSYAGSTTTTGSISTGRMLPSTQNATRTITSYSSGSNSVSKYKLPPAVGSVSTGIRTSTDSVLSSPYRSRFTSTTCGTTTTTTTVVTTTTTTTTTSSYDILPTRSSSRFSSEFYTSGSSTDYNSYTSGKAGITSSSSSGYHSPPSEVIDQTYKKYLTSSSSTALATSPAEAIYSTVNKPTIGTAGTTKPASRAYTSYLDDTEDSFLSSKRTNTVSSGYLMDGGSSIESYSKPLISGDVSSTTQLYPSRLTSSIASTPPNTTIVTLPVTTTITSSSGSMIGNTGYSYSSSSSDFHPTTSLSSGIESSSLSRRTYDTGNDSDYTPFARVNYSMPMANSGLIGTTSGIDHHSSSSPPSYTTSNSNKNAQPSTGSSSWYQRTGDTNFDGGDASVL